MAKVLTFVQLPLGEKLLVAEATLFLLIGLVIRRFIPFQRWIHWMGVVGYESPAEPLTARQEAQAKAIHGSLSQASQLHDALINCLVLSIAGKLMLRRRRIPSTLYFSVKGVRSETDAQLVSSHAWIRVGQLHFRESTSVHSVILYVGDKF